MPGQEGGITTFSSGVIITGAGLRAVNNQAVGDKVHFWGNGSNGNDFVIGIQSGRMVVALPTTSALGIRVASSLGAATSGTEGMRLWPSGLAEIANVQYSAGVVSKNANYVMSNNYTERVVLVDASGGARTITLPAVAGGVMTTIKKIDSSANAVTVSRAGTATIDGATTKSLAAQYNSITLASDGTNWHVIGTT